MVEGKEEEETGVRVFGGNDDKRFVGLIGDIGENGGNCVFTMSGLKTIFGFGTVILVGNLMQER